jgi:hypothetical protein
MTPTLSPSCDGRIKSRLEDGEARSSWQLQQVAQLPQEERPRPYGGSFRRY